MSISNLNCPSLLSRGNFQAKISNYIISIIGPSLRSNSSLLTQLQDSLDMPRKGVNFVGPVPDVWPKGQVSHLRSWLRFCTQRGISGPLSSSKLSDFAAFLIVRGYSSTNCYLSSVVTAEGSTVVEPLFERNYTRLRRRVTSKLTKMNLNRAPEPDVPRPVRTTTDESRRCANRAGYRTRVCGREAMGVERVILRTKKRGVVTNW